EGQAARVDRVHRGIRVGAVLFKAALRVHPNRVVLNTVIRLQADHDPASAHPPVEAHVAQELPHLVAPHPEEDDNKTMNNKATTGRIDSNYKGEIQSVAAFPVFDQPYIN
ncbi:MAG: hypothetical protein RLZZ630_1229, partial [Bacteroidota bacterium]